MTEALKPRDAGDLFLQTFRVVFKDLGRLLIAQALVFGPLLVIIAVSIAAFYVFLRPMEDDEPVFVTATVVLGVLNALLLMLVSPLTEAVTTLLIADQFTGHQTTIAKAFGIALRRLWGLLTLGFIRTAIIGSGFIIAACIYIPVMGLFGTTTALVVVAILGGFAIYFAVRFTCTFAVATEAFLLEQMGAFAALQRSRALTKDFRVTILLLLVLVTIVLIAVTTALKIPLHIFSLVPFAAVATVALVISKAVENAVSGMVGAAMMLAVYFDLRVRKDSFDLDNLAELVDEIQARAEDSSAESASFMPNDPATSYTGANYTGANDNATPEVGARDTAPRDVETPQDSAGESR